MRVRSFGSLIYREFFLARKNIGSNLCGYVAFTILGLLIYLSFQYGNLAQVEADRESITMFIYMFPLLTGSGFCFSLAESCKREVYTPWMRFCHTTPVGCVKLALAKYVTLTLLNIISFVIAGTYMWVIAKVSGESLGMGQFSVVIILLTFCNIFGIILQVFTMFFKSQDKAGILMAVILVATEVVVVTKQTKSIENAELIEQMLTWEGIQSWCLSHLAICLMIFVLSNVVGFVATALLYKRREK